MQKEQPRKYVTPIMPMWNGCFQAVSANISTSALGRQRYVHLQRSRLGAYSVRQVDLGLKNDRMTLPFSNTVKEIICNGGEYAVASLGHAANGN